jgi:hypothetical protein
VTVYVYFHNLCGYCEFMYFIDFSFQICCLCYSCYSVLTNFFHGYDLCQKVSWFWLKNISKSSTPVQDEVFSSWTLFFDLLCNSLDGLSYYSLNY